MGSWDYYSQYMRGRSTTNQVCIFGRFCDHDWEIPLGWDDGLLGDNASITAQDFIATLPQKKIDTNSIQIVVS
jgi:hypothetical protein